MEEPYDKVIIRDVETGRTAKWPFQNSVDQIVFEQWLDKVVDTTTDAIIQTRDRGKAINTIPITLLSTSSLRL